ncbi:UNVERIFIED_CONTAM: hypothetical protein FKN15_057543 [Acipenser sinensis]
MDQVPDNSDQESTLLDSPQNLSFTFTDGNHVPSTSYADLYPVTRPSAPALRRSKHSRQQAQSPEQLFYKDWPLAKPLKTLHHNNINIPAGSNRMALFKMHCTFIFVSPMFSPSRRHTSANLPAHSPRTGSRRRTSSPVMVPASSLSTPVQQPGDAAKTDPIFQLHNNIFEDMKSLIHPISIASINTRLNDMDKRVTSSSAATAISPGSALATLAPAVVSSSPCSCRPHIQPGNSRFQSSTASSCCQKSQSHSSSQAANH